MMSTKNGSAEVYQLDDARMRLRPGELNPSDFVSVGAYLNAARLTQNLPLEEVAERTHIRPSYLDAIERMQFSELPARAFAIGFVRVFAEALELDPEPIVARFKQEAGVPGAQKAAAESVESKAPPPPERADLSLLAVIAITAFFVWCAHWIARSATELTPLSLDAFDGVEPGAATAADDLARLAGAATPANLIEARAVDTEDPVYPPVCETQAGEIEFVEVAYTVAANGRVKSERVVEATNRCFERAALNALRQWRFVPRQIDGAPAPAFDQRVRFRFDRPE